MKNRLCVFRRMPLPWRLHEGPGPQTSLHPQWVGAQSGVSYDNCLMMICDCSLPCQGGTVGQQRNHTPHQTKSYYVALINQNKVRCDHMPYDVTTCRTMSGVGNRTPGSPKHFAPDAHLNIWWTSQARLEFLLYKEKLSVAVQ